MDPLFVVPEAHITDSKYAEPTIAHSRPTDSDHQGVVVDVLSIGSETRPEYVSNSLSKVGYTFCDEFKHEGHLWIFHH